MKSEKERLFRFPDSFADSVHGFAGIFMAVESADPDISLSAFTKARSGCANDACLVQQQIKKLANLAPIFLPFFEHVCLLDFTHNWMPPKHLITFPVKRPPSYS